MPSILQPFNSKVRITPYSQRLLQYGIQDSKVYLSKATNTILNAFTMGYSDDFLINNNSNSLINYDDRDSCILDGLNTTWRLENNTIYVKVSSGMSIVDTTLLIFPLETEIDLNLNNYGVAGHCGKIIISINFQWIDSVYEMPPKLKISYLDPDNNFLVEPNGWFLNQDKLIINVLEFDKDSNGNVLVNSIKSLVPNPCNNIESHVITVKDHPYEISPLSKLWYNIINTIESHYNRKLKVEIPGYVDPTTVESSKFKIPITFENIDNVNILTLTFNILINGSENISGIRFYNSDILNNSYKNVTLLPNSDFSNIQVQISSSNMLPIMDGILGDFEFDLSDTSIKGNIISFSLDSITGYDEFSNTVSLNGGEGVTPQLEINDSFTVNRPTPPPVDLNPILRLMIWKLDTPPKQIDSKLYFKSEINISSLGNREDFIVQCYIDNLQIHPAFIEVLSDKVQIWMPESFINMDPIPVIKVIIIG